MCKAMENFVADEMQLRNRETAKSLLALGKLTYEEISLTVGIPIDEVKALDAQRSA